MEISLELIAATLVAGIIAYSIYLVVRKSNCATSIIHKQQSDELEEDPQDAEAQYELGMCYYKGEGESQDYTQAVYWWRKAAEQGYSKAQYWLSQCYTHGKGVKTNYTQAEYWYHKADEQSKHSTRRLIIKSPETAEDFYSKYTVPDETGEGISSINTFLAGRQEALDARKRTRAEDYFTLKHVVKKSDTENCINNELEELSDAASWYDDEAMPKENDEENLIIDTETSDEKNKDGVLNINDSSDDAEQEYPEAEFCFDSTKASHWIRKEAEQGNKDAQVHLGIRYAKGKGVDQDHAQAIYWYRKAAEQGHAYAQNALKKYNLDLDPSLDQTKENKITKYTQ